MMLPVTGHAAAAENNVKQEKAGQDEQEIMWMVWLMTVWLSAISVADIRSRRVPIWMLVPGGITVLAILICRYNSGGINGFALLCGLLPGIVMLVLALSTRKAGYGDGIVLLLLGVVSEDKVLMVYGVSLFLIAAGSVILLVLRRAGKDTAIPYLPFLTAAWLLVGIF